MGHYDSEYQNYYNSLKSRANYSPHYNKAADDGSFFSQKWNYLSKRIIRDLGGVLVLFAFVIVCKTVQIPQTKSVYSYSRKIIDQNYDYSRIKTQFKNININDIKSGACDVLNRIRVNEEE